MKSPFHRGLRRRMQVWVLGSVSVLLAVLIGWIYYLSSGISRAQIELHSQHHRVEVDQTLKLGEFFGSAATITHLLKGIFEESPFPPDGRDIAKRIDNVLQMFPQLTGCGYFFEPYAVDPKQKSVGYYGYRTKEGPISHENPDNVYLTELWYLKGVKKTGGSWSKPYKDKGASNERIVTYTLPLEHGGKTVGVVEVDVSITAIKKQLDTMAFTEAAYYFLLGPDGQFLSIPKAKHNATLQEVNPTLAAAIMSDTRSMVENDPVHKKPAWISWFPMPTTDLTLAFVTPMDELLAQTRQLQRLLIATGIVGLFGLFFVTRFIAGSISRPIEDLTESVKRISAGDLDTVIPALTRDDEISELTSSFNQMTKDLRAHIAESQAAAAAQARLERDLHISRDIQMGLLPKTFPAFPGRTEFDLHALIEPAREVGGDFYDYFLLSENRLCFVIGDVSDKGIPAAILMAVTKTLIEATAREWENPGRTAEVVNQTLHKGNEAIMFVTVFLGILDLDTGQITYCNAGHNPPLLLRHAGSKVDQLPLTDGAALGVFPDLSFSCGSATMNPGDLLLLYTDGVTEAMTAAGIPYRCERLIELLGTADKLSAKELTRKVFDDVKYHASGAPQSDDIAILAIHYEGGPLCPQGNLDIITAPECI